jgi:ribosomal protein S18 acetylase RimI-like enzyme
MTPSALEFTRLKPADEVALADFFAALTACGDDRFFHPHPFTAPEAARVCRLEGRDLYVCASQGGRILAYGMLRGWDEGYAVPSLGVALHPDARGTGLARAFMSYLHSAARAQGAARVRLKVYPANYAARRLYESLGYQWQPGTDEQLLGVCELAPARAA